MNTGTVQLDLHLVAQGLGLPPGIVQDMLKDGRFASRVAEERMAIQFQARRVQGDKDHDLLLHDGSKIEVRCLTKNVNFAPNYMRGTGRKFDEDGFLKKLEDVDLFCVVDVNRIPTLPWVVLDSKFVLDRYNYQLCPRGNVTRTRWKEFLQPLDEKAFTVAHPLKKS